MGAQQQTESTNERNASDGIFADGRNVLVSCLLAAVGRKSRAIHCETPSERVCDRCNNNNGTALQPIPHFPNARRCHLHLVRYWPNGMPSPLVSTQHIQIRARPSRCCLLMMGALCAAREKRPTKRSAAPSRRETCRRASAHAIQLNLQAQTSRRSSRERSLSLNVPSVHHVRVRALRARVCVCANNANRKWKFARPEDASQLQLRFRAQFSRPKRKTRKMHSLQQLRRITTDYD